MNNLINESDKYQNKKNNDSETVISINETEKVANEVMNMTMLTETEVNNIKIKKSQSKKVESNINFVKITPISSTNNNNHDQTKNSAKKIDNLKHHVKKSFKIKENKVIMLLLTLQLINALCWLPFIIAFAILTSVCLVLKHNLTL